MNKDRIIFSVFTKPWKTKSIEELGKFIHNLGFDGIEFPLRPGYQVEPQNAEKGLPELARRLDQFGVKITSIAGDMNQSVFAGCAEARIPVIRIMAGFDPKRGYLIGEKERQKDLEKMLPLCEKYKVKIGVQPHFGYMVSNSMELRHFVEPFDPKYIGAVWDAGHSGLAGEEPEQGLDIVWSHLCMVNLKNAFYRRVNGPEAKEAKWERYFTLGCHGLSSFSRIAAYLKSRDYQGVICLTAEYDAGDQAEELITQDIAYVKSLFK